MARLNRETFGRRGPTNVIAFPLDDSPPFEGVPCLLGEVVISLPTAARQAQDYGWPIDEMLDYYLIHGILHLLGYDHHDPQEANAMEEKTWDLLKIVKSPEP